MRVSCVCWCHSVECNNKTRWTQQNSLRIFTVVDSFILQNWDRFPAFVLCCVLACKLLESVPGAFFVRDDHTYKVGSCNILHDVFTVQPLMVATVAQPKQQATIVGRSLHLTPSLVALVARHTAYHDIVGRVAPVAFAWRSSIDDPQMLGSEIKVCKPPQNDLKKVKCHRHDLSVWRSVLDCPSKTKIWV